MNTLEQVTSEEVTSKTSLTKKIYSFGEKFIDYKMGLLGAGIMGGIIFGVNYHESHELLGSTTAALKQGGYTFLFGGAVMKGNEYLATKIKNKAEAITCPIVIPSICSILLTYGMHNLKGTPEPEKSTLVTILTVVPATAIQGYRKRKQQDSENNYLY